ncbi:MAG: signal peptidase II [Coriobacteriia bacterium]|nr:signal peptidase II [Coriobacteriia bacterium]
MGGVGLRGRSVLLPLTAFAVVVLDQLVKVAVRARLPLGEPVPLVPGVLWLTHVDNTGGAFSILAGRQWVFMTAAAGAIVAVAVFWALGRPGRFQALALGLVAGGAAGNLADRVLFGRVTDYLDVRWWPVFNVADMALVGGISGLVAWLLFGQHAPTRPAGTPPGGGGEGAGAEGSPRGET